MNRIKKQQRQSNCDDYFRAWRNPHLLKSFQQFNVPLDFIKFLSTEFATCWKAPSKDNRSKVSCRMGDKKPCSFY